MLKYSFAALFVLSLGFTTGCKNRSKNGPSAKEGSTIELPADWSLTIRHTGCRGNCPDYEILVYASGSVTYTGHHAVEKMGIFAKEISTEKVAELHQTLLKYDFQEMEEVYGGGVADLPSVITVLNSAEGEKKVQNIRNAPPEVSEMQQKLEAIIGDDGYKVTQ